MPAVFAFADNVVGQPQTTIFSAFGSFAILVMADFTGPPRARLVSYLALAGTGAALISLGTLCSQSPAAATAVMAVVGFVILFSGVINRYLAAGSFAALVTFIISVNVPVPASAIPDRLEGWLLASVVGISAAMLLWPPRQRGELRAAAARACAALGDLLESELTRDARLVRSRAAAAREAVGALRRCFVATPYRPTGAAGSTEALGFLVDELDWLRSLVGSPAAAVQALRHDEQREAIGAAGAVLHASAATLNGLDERPDLERLVRARDAVVEALVLEVRRLPAGGDDDAAVLPAIEPSFRVRELASAAWDVGANALAAVGSAPPDVHGARRTPSWAPRAVAELLADHARLRSVWFRNSVRGAAALTIAVYVAQRAGVQHAFWVVLGTLSVLRSNALGTGSTILQAVAGTAVGILIGVALILAIGSNQALLWAVLPFAVLLAAFAPRAVSFAAGQAGFTVVVVILFNIIQPTGWQVGLIRVEDVALGFAISLGVGLLFWPRGAASVLRERLAEAFVRSAGYLAATVKALGRRGDGSPARDAHRARAQARAAAHLLDDAVRQFLAERGADGLDLDSVGALVAGATRVRLAAYSLLTMTAPSDAPAGWDRCASALDEEADALACWYVALGDAVASGTSAPSPHRLDPAGGRHVGRCVREAVADGDSRRIRAAVCLALAHEQLRNLEHLESDLAEAAAELARPRSGAAAS
ncbi:MAG: hypothetical protein QOJ85_1048 [Solirubrobacteraceae bacterium]|jgi:uncharacterized membrane protein YccC|nr:hypothetical protein [Solirubrobacteraceae bacterium]MEA2243583.1 hypothetical protein [Solirubrobacteraceae bacterium]